MRQLDEHTFVSGQIRPEQVAELRRHGVTLIVNNRPDGEDDGQPSSATIAAAAADAGIAYRHIPIARGIGPAEVTAMQDALAAAGEGNVLAFCRAGTRSTLAWALARRAEGATRDELEEAAARAGMDLMPIAHLL